MLLGASLCTIIVYVSLQFFILSQKQGDAVVY